MEKSFENNYKYWQSMISHVPQEIFVADTTIAENIALGQKIEDINLKKIKRYQDRLKFITS